MHWVLEDAVPEVWVINARHMRNVPGRKTDVADAQWGRSCWSTDWCARASSRRVARLEAMGHKVTLEPAA